MGMRSVGVKEKRLSHLIKVLRPQVYITSTSDFKRLVQQLTGNGSSSPPPLVHVEDDHIHGGGTGDRRAVLDPDCNCSAAAAEEAASYNSFEASVDSFDQQQLLCEAEMNLVQSNETTTSSSSMNQQYYWEDWIAFQEIESWLLDDVDHDQDVSVYDEYELSSWATDMN